MTERVRENDPVRGDEKQTNLDVSTPSIREEKV
jgi:hypothetical protein